MKTTGFFILLLFLTLQCKGQETEKSISPVDYINLIQDEYINITTIEPVGREPFTCLDYEFSVRYLDRINGNACLYAVPKNLSDVWVKESRENPLGDCAREGRFTEVFYPRCEARRMFREDTLKLFNDFDLYVFHIDKVHLEGPFQESAESGPVDYYVPVSQAPVLVYNYQQGQWVHVDTGILKDGHNIPRVFGWFYLQEKFAR